jgi:pimeloyl-ACP methyl ester carboxylesterase
MGAQPLRRRGHLDPCRRDGLSREIYRAPRSWAERHFHNLIYWNEVEKGGHFAAWEQPELFTTEIQAAFTSLR